MKTEQSVWIDTHCHLEMLKGDDIQEALKKSKELGVGCCITIGTDAESNRFVDETVKNYSNVYGSVGIHPHDAEKSQKEDYEEIVQFAEKNEKILAIGECGFDFYYEHSSEQEQKKSFEKQILIALELGLPLVVHTREAEKQTKDMMQSYFKEGLRAVFHSFTSSKEFARFGLDQGAFFSFNGIATFKNAEDVRDVIRYIPLKQMLIETDAPFLTPIPFRGKPNYPGYVSLVGKYIAEMLGVQEQAFAEQLKTNTESFFNLPEGH